jgi:hypothetical protein
MNTSEQLLSRLPVSPGLSLDHDHVFDEERAGSMDAAKLFSSMATSDCWLAFRYKHCRIKHYQY